MNKMVQTNITKQVARLAALLVLLLIGIPAMAQDVHIGPDNGNLIHGIAGGQSTDSGLSKGLYAMWRHEQLALCMTTSDLANLTSGGELADPCDAIGVYDGHLIIAAGQTQTFVVVSLPKGYRITGYRLVLIPNLLNKNVEGPDAASNRDFYLYHSTGNTNGSPNGNKGTMAFYETPAWSSGSPYGENTHDLDLDCPDAIATASAISGSDTLKVMDPTKDADKEFVLERESQSPDDMGNQLHFFFARTCSQYGVTIKSFMIYFTAEGTFDAEVTPAASGTATDYVTSPFTTSKVDIGSVSLRTLTNNGRQYQLYAYDYTGVQDLRAYTHLYQDNAYTD